MLQHLNIHNIVSFLLEKKKKEKKKKEEEEVSKSKKHNEMKLYEPHSNAITSRSRAKEFCNNLVKTAYGVGQQNGIGP